MLSRDVSPNRKDSGSAPNSPSKDGLDKVELSDLDSSPPPLPIESDLMQLARLGELRAIQKLFDGGRYNAKSTDDQGTTALHWAAINGHHALCHFLLQSGADVNARGGDLQGTPVLWASKRSHLQVVSLLLQHGADPLTRDGQGYNLLLSATLDGNVYQIILLLHHPAIPVDVPDLQGHTPLMRAAFNGFPACVDILLRFGADPRAVDDTGLTALHWALIRGSYPCIQKLVEHGADRFALSMPAEGQPEGHTPSMTAAMSNHERQWHKALLNSGYDKNGSPLHFPLPMVQDKRWFFKRVFFLWPFVLGGLQLHMLAYMAVWISVPGVLVLGFALQFGASKLLRWAPSDMKHMHKTPVLAGIFAGTLFWVGVRYIFRILPATLSTGFFLNLFFATCYGLCTYFYFMTMTADPGFLPKGGSRGQTKKTIDELLEHNAFDETHFCTVCMIRKPLRSKHCRACGRCVAREDHHCPWVDNCVAVNNHKHFLLYVTFMIIGIGILIRLTIAYLEVLPAAPSEHLNCAILKDEYCAILSKDPLTIVTNAWASLQLTWTFMLVFVHLIQIAKNLTTFESMRHTDQVIPLMSAITAGTMSVDGAQLGEAGAGPDPVNAHGRSHDHKHSHKKKKGFLARWSQILGIDTFLAVAFQGYNGSKGGKKAKSPAKKVNPFSRGVVRNCQDFWLDGPFFGRKESNKGLIGGHTVDYASLYEVPKGGMQYRRGYEQVATADDEV